MAEAPEAFPVGFYDLLIDERKLFLQPGEEGGAEVETDRSIVVGDIENLPLLIDDSGIPIGAVALEGDPFIPVVERVSALLPLDGSEPGVFPGRLIEVTVDGSIAAFDFSRRQSSSLWFGLFHFINAFLDAGDLFGDRDLFGTDLRTLPEGLAPPGPVLMI
jgi:hypothetical protein